MGMNPRLLRPILSGDPDALRYIAAVQTADQQSLEPAVRKAITDFIVGCKADGIWSAIKASCILMGARTLSGALTPLVGPAPTNNGPFVSGDYNRKTGLIGNGTSKELNSNRNNNADPQNSQHISAIVGQITGGGAILMGTAGTAGSSQMVRSGATHQTRSRNTSAGVTVTGGNIIGFRGISRSSGSEYFDKITTTDRTATNASQTPLNANIFVHSQGGANFSTDRIAFYSIGEALSLTSLESRASALFTAIGAAIP
jgi:hypothetical protein